MGAARPSLHRLPGHPVGRELASTVDVPVRSKHRQRVPDNPRGDFVFLRQVSLGPAAAEPVSWYLVDRTRDAQSDPDEPGDTPDGYERPPRRKARSGSRSAPPPTRGADVAELMRLSGMTKPTLYRHLAAHAEADARSRSAAGGGSPPRPRMVGDERLSHPLVSSHALRVSARKGAH